MRRLFALSVFVWVLLAGLSAEAATGRVIKVLPHFLDLKGRHANSPSLYDRDAYQAYLRQHPEQRSGMRFDVQWKAKPDANSQLKLRLEVRGVARGKLPVQQTLEQPVHRRGFFSQWNGIALTGDNYASVGEVTAWRVTLWDGAQQLGEQKSFLW